MLTGTFDFKKIIELLGTGQQKVVIISHRNPDGDAIGASMALFRILTKIGHRVDVIVPNAVPSFLQWMPDANKIIIYAKSSVKADKLMDEATIFFCLDFNDIGRIREFEEHVSRSSAYKVLIDHHPDPSAFSDLTISDTHLSSTSELLYLFIQQIGLGYLIDREVAGCIYTGIMTDTGCFSFNSSLPETFKLVAELLSYNPDKDFIFDKVYNNYSSDRMKLMGYCLDKKMQVLPEFRTAYITLTQEEMRQHNFRIGDSEGFVNLPLSIEGIIFSILFVENKEMVRVSFRSKGNFKVNNLASEHFKGGGHVNAAGGESYDTLENTVQKLVNLLPKYKDELLAE
jgi:bifunctional oligoribonuclease and PAP phosphatase NrnA